MSGGMGGPYAEAVVASVVAEIGADVRPSSSSTTPLSDFDADDSPPYRRAKEAQFMAAAAQNAGSTPLGVAAVRSSVDDAEGDMWEDEIEDEVEAIHCISLHSMCLYYSSYNGYKGCKGYKGYKKTPRQTKPL